VWRTAASDGHATNGRFTFSVQAPAPPAAIPPANPPASVPATQTQPAARNTSNAPITSSRTRGATNALRWAELIAVLTLVGAVVFRLFVLPEAQWTPDLRDDASDRARRFASALFVLFAVTTITRLMAQSDLIADAQGDRWHAVIAVIRDTRWGHGWLI